MIVDSHAHLEDAAFDADRDDIIDRAWDNYIRSILTIHGDMTPERCAIHRDLLDRYAFIYGAAALHPHEASRFNDGIADHLHGSWKHPKVIAVGETGLDYYYLHSPRKDQALLFRWHINQARIHHLPLLIHTREAHTETLSILADEKADEVGGIIHCYTGDPKTMKKYLDLGFYISFSGIVTFAKAQESRDSALQVPLDRLLVETDCPYLAPAPYRGRRNEPAYVLKVIEFLAKLRHMNIGVIKDAVYTNFHRLFHLVPADESPSPRKRTHCS